MILGPEFQRNIWMRFSLFSVLVIPALIAAGVGLVYLGHMIYENQAELSRALNGLPAPLYEASPHWSAGTLAWAVPFMIVMLFGLGILEAGSSFTAELRNKTWDLQKVSAISPFHLLVGKVFGSTSYAWFVSLCLMVVILFSYSHLFKDMTVVPDDGSAVQPVLIYPAPWHVFMLGVMIVFSALCGHVVAAYVSIKSLRAGSFSGFRGLLVGGVASFFAFAFFRVLFEIPFVSEGDLSKQVKTISWYGHDIQSRWLVFSIFVYFVIWAIIGLYRMIREELNFQRTVLVKLAFLLSLSAVFAGFGVEYSGQFSTYLVNTDQTLQFSIIPFLVFLMATYYALNSSAKSFVPYQRFLHALKSRQYRRVFETIPDWIILLPLTLIFWVFVTFDQVTEKASVLPYILFAIILFMIRDALVTHYLLLGGRFKRGRAMEALFKFFAYVILPVFIFQIIHLSEGDLSFREFLKEADGYGYLIAAFYPFALEDAPLFYLAPVFLQLVVFGFLLWRVIVRYKKDMLRP